ESFSEFQGFKPAEYAFDNIRIVALEKCDEPMLLQKLRCFSPDFPLLLEEVSAVDASKFIPELRIAPVRFGARPNGDRFQDAGEFSSFRRGFRLRFRGLSFL